MKSRSDVRLSEQESLLLKAALLPTQAAVQAWGTWLGTLDFEKDTIPADWFQLLPLVYMNLAEAKPATTQLNRLKGIYNQAWYRSQIDLQPVVSVLMEMKAEGLKFCLLDDTSWLERSIQELAARPDFEISVYLPMPDFLKACALLDKHGWKAQYLSFPLHKGDRRYNGGSALGIHLTWKPFPLASTSANSRLMDRSKTLTLDGVQFLAAQPLDCLIFAACQYIYSAPHSQLRCLARTGLLLRDQHFEKPKLHAFARELRANQALSAALELLDLPVSHQILQSAPMLNPTMQERFTAWLIRYLRPRVQSARRHIQRMQNDGHPEKSRNKEN